MKDKLVRVSSESHKLLNLYAVAQGESLKSAIEHLINSAIEADSELQPLFIQLANHSATKPAEPAGLK
ncbi:MAG: hypothetical protein WC553_02495 [Patescibacteria group bacterium]|jgi:hypothetical protein